MSASKAPLPGEGRRARPVILGAYDLESLDLGRLSRAINLQWPAGRGESVHLPDVARSPRLFFGCSFAGTAQLPAPQLRPSADALLCGHSAERRHARHVSRPTG